MDDDDTLVNKLIEARIGTQALISVIAAAIVAAVAFALLALVEVMRIEGRPTFEFTGNLGAYTLAVLSVAAAILIGIRQTRQLWYQNTQLENQRHQLDELKAISENLQRDKILAANVPRFFRKSAETTGTCDCFVPGLEEGNPLPNLKAGDHIALQVYDKSLSPHGLRLFWVNSTTSHEPNGHSLHVGSPTVNTVLGGLFNDQRRRDLQIPIWFDGTAQVTIRDAVREREYWSPADPLYNVNDPNHLRMSEKDSEVEDRALLARLTVNGHVHIIVAGIHQFGTWIAAEMLDRLLSERIELNGGINHLYRAAFDSADFIAHVKGGFTKRTLHTDNYSVQDLYVLGENGWSAPFHQNPD